MNAWFVVSLILGVLWAILFLLGNCFFLFSQDFTDNKQRWEEYQYFAAIMAGALVVVIFHWIILVLTIPAFVLFGLFTGIRILIKKPWRENA